MNSPDKSAVLRAFADQAAAQLAALTKATEATYRAATDTDSRAENKYDTRTLEASYLARGQAQRVEELRAVHSQFEAWLTGNALPPEAVAVSTWVTLKMSNGISLSFLIALKGGGMEATVNGVEITVITPQSPLGAQLLGKRLHDSVSLPTGATASITALQ
jgi:transcription elongation GreA/GreB family factor